MTIKASSASSSSVMDSPPSALPGSRRFVGEASRRCARNRERARRYQICGYTSFLRLSVPKHITTRERVAAAYHDHYDALRYIAERQYRVPKADSESIIHDVFVRFIRHHGSISDDAGWLVRSLRNACLNYWRDRKPTEALPSSLANTSADLNARVDLIRLLGRITARCRRILWLRYVDGLTPDEIARKCAASASPGYGRILIHRCLAAARAALTKATGRA